MSFSWKDVLQSPDKYLTRISPPYRQDFLLAARAKVKYLETQERSHIVDLKFFKTEDCGSIEEARSSGISYKLLCDTRDKFVIHPGHLGCEEFDYPFEKGSWGDCSGGLSSKIIRAMSERIVGVGRAFKELGFECYLIGLNCDGKGYLSLDGVEVVNQGKINLDEYPLDRDVVLFVYI